MRTSRVLILAGVLAVLAGCRPDDQRTDSIDLQEAVQEREGLDPRVLAHIDSGSAAFREDDFERAAGHYRRAVELDPDAAAAWFGIYMAEDALGHEEEAAAALERARQEVPGASLIHPSRGDTAR